VIECVPTVSDAVVIVAAPPLTAALPIAVKPSLKVTDPVADAGTTVAVSTIGTPKSDGELLDVTVTMPVGFTTVIATVAVAPL
jgi:hypothetical protein